MGWNGFGSCVSVPWLLAMSSVIIIIIIIIIIGVGEGKPVWGWEGKEIVRLWRA
jgi:hypothetical protein